MADERYRHWAFTLNNYTDDDIVAVEAVATTATCVVYGKEISETGTPHLQGFISFPNARRATSLHKLFPSSAHWSVARQPFAAYQYCLKDGDYREFGTKPLEPRKGACKGRRTDLAAVRDAIKEGEIDRKRLREMFPDQCGKYGKFIDQLILDQVPAPELQMHPLRDWQGKLLENLKLPPDDRTIYFVVDKDGNSGKTWFCSYHEKVYGNSTVLMPGKKADQVYAFLQTLTSKTKTVFVDCPRAKGDLLQYDFLEELKNGRVMQTKYESRMQTFRVPHVVVFMNQQPDMTKLSEDRYFIINI